MKIGLIVAFCFTFFLSTALADGGEPSIALVETVLADKSLVVRYEGRLYRAITAEQMRSILRMESELAAYRNEALECRAVLTGRNTGE